MHPAPSLIVFTVLSGAGFGMIASLGFGLGRTNGWEPWLAGLLALALAGGGLAASTRHLGNPQRALLAFTQWRSSWLSREAVAAAATLILFGIYLFAWLLFGARIYWIGFLAGAGAVATIICTAMIYAQLKTVPRWSKPPTPVLFLAFAASGGFLGLSAIENMLGYPPTIVVWKAAMALIASALAAQLWGSMAADVGRDADGSTPETATGLGAYGTVRQLDPPHSAPNYLLKEMVFEIGRKRAKAVRTVALGAGLLLPFLLTLGADFLPGRFWMLPAFALHLVGVAAHRWLFFAEAEHVVGLYYGKR
jgi:DMSO reductase anchor subunit